MPKSPFVVSSERHLLTIHNTMTPKIKSFKRLFIKRGKMMKTFDYINWLHQIGDYASISQMITQLYADLPHLWTPRHYKYLELIQYCIFLEYYRYKLDEEEGIMLAGELIDGLNLGHELGRTIEKRVKQMLHTESTESMSLGIK